jgi:hypothetical protein
MAAMAGEDWIEIAIKAGIALAGGVSGLFIGVYRWGRSSGKAETAADTKISALREEMRTAMASHAMSSDARTDLLVEQFKESFEGIRRQHDDHKLDVERRFLLKDDFKDFREEYREDMRDIKTAIANIARSP